MEKDKINRGEIYIADLEPVRGSEEGKERRVIIISNDIGNNIGPTVIALPITTKITEKRLRLPMFVKLYPTKENGQTELGLIDCNQIRVLSKKERIGDYKGVVSNNVMLKVDAAIETCLALKRCPDCDYVLMPNKKHCVNRSCGVLLMDVCSMCSQEVSTNHKFCPNCGTKRG